MKFDKITFQIGILCIGLLFLVACTTTNEEAPCVNKPDIYINLSDVDKGKIPYSMAGYDTLVYRSNANDTAILIGQGRKNYYNIVPFNGGNPACYQGSKRYERMDIFFLGSNNELFEIKYGAGRLPLSDKGTIDYYVNGKAFHSLLLSGNFDDTIKIGNNVYYGINLKGSDTDADTVNTSFYSPSEGILRIKFLNEKTWIRH